MEEIREVADEVVNYYMNSKFSIKDCIKILLPMIKIDEIKCFKK